VSWRFLAGIDERGLCSGWSELVRGYPVYRRLNDIATVELDPITEGPLVLQVHAGHLQFDVSVPRLVVRVADRMSEVLVGAGWNTFHVPLPPSVSRQTIELDLLPDPGWRDGLMVNEVSLLGESSPLLLRYRRRLSLTAPEMARLGPAPPSDGEGLGPGPWHLETGSWHRGRVCLSVRASVRARGQVRLLVDGHAAAACSSAPDWRWIAGTVRNPHGIIEVAVEGESVDVAAVEIAPAA
jgi:hypothetical protein